MSVASDYAEAAAQHRQRLLKRIRDLENNTDRDRTCIKRLKDSLFDARRDYVDLVGLVEMMGQHVKNLTAARSYCYSRPDYPFTIAGQREWQAAMHEAEGAPVTREDCVP